MRVRTDEALQSGHKAKLRRALKQDLIAWSLIIIPVVWWCIFFLYAFVRSVYFSFTDLRFSIENISTFNFDNYIRLFQDKTFYRALGNTGLWTLVMTVANNVLGILFAFLIFRLNKGNKFFLALLFWPSLVSAVTSAQIIKTVFSPSDTGLANQLFGIFGIEPLGWYNDPSLALVSLMIIPLILGFSTQMMLYYVALIGVPKSYVEAVRLDTCSEWVVLRHVYLPLIRNVLSLNLLLSIINNLKVLGPMQLVGDGTGGPLDSTITLMLLLYNKGITGYEMGYACAIGVVAFVIILLLSVIQQKLTGKGVEYD